MNRNRIGRGWRLEWPSMRNAGTLRRLSSEVALGPCGTWHLSQTVLLAALDLYSECS